MVAHAFLRRAFGDASQRIFFLPGGFAGGAMSIGRFVRLTQRVFQQPPFAVTQMDALEHSELAHVDVWRAHRAMASVPRSHLDPLCARGSCLTCLDVRLTPLTLMLCPNCDNGCRVRSLALKVANATASQGLGAKHAPTGRPGLEMAC